MLQLHHLLRGRFKDRWRLGVIAQFWVVAFVTCIALLSLTQSPALAMGWGADVPVVMGIVSPPTVSHSEILQLGSEGSDVEEIQSQLKTLGYYSADITGIFDENTLTAVQSLQTDHELVPDGVVGTFTHQALQSSDTGSSSLSATTASNSRHTLPRDIQRIKNRGKLVVALLGRDNPPFFMVNQDDELTGLDVKIAEGLADALGVSLEFNREAETFNQVVDQVDSLNADIAISKLSRTLTRGIRVRFSNPYVRMRQGLLVNRLLLAEQTKGRSVIETIRDLQGKVGVIDGSSYVGFLQQKFPNATIEGFPSWEDIEAAVTSGEILAGYRDELEVKKIVLSKPDAALQLQTIALTDTEDPIAMAFPWDSTHLVAFVNQYLDTMKLEYTADLVLDEYADYFRS